MTVDIPQPPTPEAPQNNAGMRQLTMIALFAIMFLVGVALILLFADPFEWNLLERLNGRFDAATSAMPSDTVAYVGINLLEANVARMTDIRNAFADATAGTDLDFEQPLSELDQSMMEELGINFSEDIQPWIGQFIGLGLIELRLPNPGSNTDPYLDWVLAVEARNPEEADAFLAKVKGIMINEIGETAVNELYNDVTITYFPSLSPLEELGFARSDNIVLFGSGADAIQQAIDAQSGDSLADLVTYQETTEILPSDRMVTLYIDGQQADEFADLAYQEAANDEQLAVLTEQFSATQGMNGIAIGLSFPPEGIQLDSAVTFDPSQFSDFQAASFSRAIESPETAAIAPANSVVYMAGSGLDLIWEAFKDGMRTQISQGEFDESMQLFDEQYGINPDSDLFPYLDGEIGFIVVPTTEGLIVDNAQIHLGGSVLIGTSEEATLAGNVDDFSNRISSPEVGVGTIEKTEADGLTLYNLESPLLGEGTFVYGIGHDYLLFTTSAATAQNLTFNSGTSLAGSRGYQLAQAAFPEDRAPYLFIDVQGLLNAIRMSAPDQEDLAEFDEITAVFQPMTYLAASNTVNENSARGTLILFLNTGE